MRSPAAEPGRSLPWINGSRRLSTDLIYGSASHLSAGIIGRALTLSIAAHPVVVKSMRKLPHAHSAVGYELFGVDVMLDADGKVTISPGLAWPDLT